MSWLAVELYKREMVKLGRFKLTSGLESPYYIDLRQLYSYPDLVERLVDELIKKIDFSYYDTLVGVATSGIVLASFLACRLRKPLSYVRIERKMHGTQSLVEGIVSGKRCLIVDDVATTGGSIERACIAVKEAGGVPVATLVVIDREQGAREKVERLGLKFYSYMTASELFRHLYENKIIDEKQYNDILTYIARYKPSTTGSSL
uniref:Orotate phosphoribosyltransferase n=1 Tax=Ignisphaera aggregans TaxID=334771 RepID=A0A7C2VPJ9_9CREN